MKGKYLLNISTGIIHSGVHPCSRVKRIKEENKKWFEKYEDAENYYEGNSKKGNPCAICMKEHDI